MKAIIKGAVVSGAGALLLGASLALSSASVVSGANQAHPDKSKTTINCDTGGGGNAACFHVANSSGSSGNGIDSSAADGTGIWGKSALGSGVYGSSTSGDGVSGYTKGAAAGGVFVNDTNSDVAALYAENESDGYLLAAIGCTGSCSYAAGEFFVDGAGDGYFTGSVTAYGGFTSDIRSRNGEQLAASTTMTPQATMEDTGTARLLNGEGAVRFDPAFESTIDASRGYQVFLTPDGDTRGLYVAVKYERGFVVREVERGRSSLNFDYRIVAHPYGASDARLPRITLKPPVRPNAKLPTQPVQR